MRTQSASADIRLDTTQARLQVLYAKQGRARQFKSKAERDTYLNNEIKSLASWEKQQGKVIADLKRDAESAKAQLEEVTAKASEQQSGEEEQRERLKQMSEETSKLKTDLDSMQEKRK